MASSSDSRKRRAKLDGSSTRPAYVALTDELRTAILRKHFPAGQRLPTEAELVEKYGVGRQTARRAYQELVAEGLVYRRRRSGTFARPVVERYIRAFGSIDDVLAHGKYSEAIVHEPLAIIDNEWGATKLGIADGPIAGLTYLRLDGEEPFAHTKIFVPLDVHEAIKDEPFLTTVGHRGMFTMVEVLDRLYERRTANVDQIVRSIPTPAETSALLDVEPGAPGLAIERTFSDIEGIPIEAAMTIYDATRFSYSFQMRRA